MDYKQVIVSGATNQVGFFLLPRLIAAGYSVHAVSRSNQSIRNVIHNRLTWHKIDLSGHEKKLDIPEAEYFIHLAPIWLIPDILDNLLHKGVRRIIALGSTSRYSKLNSSEVKEQDTTRKLITAEEAFISVCNSSGVAWTLFRPTMIYGCGMDRNVTMIAQFIKRFGFFLLPDDGNGYRQPVHADDIAWSCLSALNCPAAYLHAYNLSGGQTLTFREMVETIFRDLGKKPRIINIPKELTLALIKCATFLPAYRYINREMIERINQDICFDSSDASKDFGYAPREFRYE
jgi:nucleoside-diphosphate-sugar epimerase